MKLFILKADNSKEMNNISEELAQEKFKITQQENHYILNNAKSIPLFRRGIFEVLNSKKV